MSKLSDLEKQFFYHQFLILTQAKIPMDKATELIAKNRPTTKLSELLNIMAASFREGNSLSDFIGDHSDSFSSYEYDIVRSGEKSDNLEDCLQWLADLYNQEREYKRIARIQFWYMVLTSFIGFAIVILFNIFVIPVVTDMFRSLVRSLGGQLPKLTHLVVLSNNYFRNYWIFLLIIILVSIWLIRLLWRRYPELFSLIISDISWIGRKWMLQESLRFALVTGHAIEYGVPPIKALENSADFVFHPYLKYRLKNLSVYINRGHTWTNALKSIRNFPKQFVSFIQLGEEQGELGLAFLEISRTEYSREHNWNWMENILIFIFLSAIGGYLGLLGIALYLPIFTMAGAV